LCINDLAGGFGDNAGYFCVTVTGAQKCDCQYSYQGQDCATSSNPISLFGGEKREEAIDLTLNTASGALNFTRRYNQNDPMSLLGLGWTHNYGMFLDLNYLSPSPGSITLHTPNSATVIFFETGANTNQYLPSPGSTSALSFSSNQYTLIAADKSTCMFNSTGKLLSSVNTHNETQTYTYYASGVSIGKLQQVNDSYGNGLQFIYKPVSTPAQFDDGQLQYVGDQTFNATLLTGRYVKFSYVQERLNGVLAGSQALLSSVRDVLGNIWTYRYYGQNIDETDSNQQNFLVERRSPSVDTSGDGIPDGSLSIELVSYTLNSGIISQIVQSRGNGALNTTFNFQPGAQNITTETIGGRTSTHRFRGAMYLGIQDAAGNYSARTINGALRSSSQTDARGNQTNLTWSPDGKFLQNVIDPLGNQTQFFYNTNLINGVPADTLNYSIDAKGRKSQYVYTDTNNPRLPTDIKIFDVNGTTLLTWQRFVYDAAGKGRILQEQTLDPSDLSGRIVMMESDRTYYTSGNGNGLLQTLTHKDLLNPANTTTTTYFYDSVGRVVRTNQSATFGSCLSSYTVYDLAGNVIASLCNYDPNGQTDPTTAAAAISLYQTAYPGNPDKNRVTTSVYDTLGRRVQTTTDAGAPYAQTSLTVYDGLNRVIRTIGNYVSVLGINDPYLHPRADFTHGQNNDQNLITETTYNERGFAKNQIDTLGNVMLYGYDDGGRLVTSVQNASQSAYDNSSLGSDPALSRYATLIVNNRPDQDIVTRYQYDPVGNLIRATDVLGNVSLTGYDALNRPINTVQNASQPTYNLNVDPALAYYVPATAVDQDMTSYTEYDALGRVRRTQDTLGTWTLYAYDSLGRQTATVSSASYPTYDASHDPTFSNYPLSTAADQDVLTLTTYDPFGRTLYTTDVLGRKTWYVYDGLGRAIQTIANAVGTATDNGPRDPRSPLYAASTDSDKDLISTTTYDSNGYVMWSQDSLGRKTWYAYDNVGRQIRTIANASGTATDNGSRDPRSTFYVPSNAPDQDLISQTVYNAQGRVVATIDPLGNQTQYVYDSLGRRLKTISNFVTGVYNPLRPDQDLITTTTYDLVGRVVATVDSRGTRTTFTYDALGRRVTATQAAGTSLATTSYTCYDKAGRVLRVIQNWRPAATDAPPDALDSQGNWLFNPTSYGLANDQNRITSYALDLAGRQLSTTGAYILTLSGLQQRTSYAVYYKDGQIDHVTDTGGATTTYGYDKLRRRTLVIQGYLDINNQWGNPTTWYWNTTAKQWQSGTGIPIGFSGPYASNDRLRHPNSNNLIVQLSYDRAGRLLNQRDPNGNLTTYAYDLLNRRTTLTDPLSNTWLTSYARLPNGQTNLISTDANSHQTQQTFDRAGRLTTLQYLNEPSAITPNVSFDYNKLGSRLAMHETLGTSSVRNTTYAFDQARRLTAVNLDVRGDGSTIQTVSYQYDPGGLRTQLIMPDGKTVSYTYDARGQLVGLSDWNAQAVRYDYDNAGRLSAVERPNGLRSGYQYDAGSRLTQLRHTAASKTLAQFDYVPGTRGNRIKIREAIRSATTGSTVLTNTDPSISYPLGTWNPINNFSVSTDVSAALHVAFMGSQLTLQLGQGPDHGLCDLYIDDALYQTFDGYAATATDVPLSLTIGLSNDGPHTLDIRNRAERNSRASAFKVRFFSLTLPIKYDLHTMYFNRTSVINGTTTITTDGYDTASRLYFVDYFPGDNLKATPYLSYDYNYDLAGNRLAQTVTQPASSPPKVASTFTYNAANRLLTSSLQNQDINGSPIGSPTPTTYQYDNNGNQINLNNAATPVYQWDRANRLQTYTDPTTTINYTYNGVGQRLHQDGQKIVNGITGTSTTDYVLDTQPGLWKVLQATTGSTSVTSYVHGPTGLQQQYNPSALTAPLWMVPDGLGSVRSVTDNAAMPQETRFYDPYGNEIQQSGSQQTAFGFTGEPTDVNGLVHLRARYYNSALGQFINLDPLETPNRYQYASGNPTNWTDPSGLYCNAPEYVRQAAIAGVQVAAIAGLVPIDRINQVESLSVEVACQAYNAGTTFVESYGEIEVGIAAAEAVGITIGAASLLALGGVGILALLLLLPSPNSVPQPVRGSLRPPVAPTNSGNNNSCPTNAAPGTGVRFDQSSPLNEMNDIMCNIKKYTSSNGPNPDSWWQMLKGNVNLVFIDGISGGGGGFVHNDTKINVSSSKQAIDVKANTLAIPRPGFNYESRLTVMSLVVHELRHAGQYHSVFKNENIRGINLACNNISGRVAEVDALLNENHWVVHAVRDGLLNSFDIQGLLRTEQGEVVVNNGQLWDVDGLWNHPEITKYQRFYPNRFDTPPCFSCPNFPSIGC